MNRTDIKDGNDFKEALIGITNYMASYQQEVVAFEEPIEVCWGFKNEKRLVIPTVALVDKTVY